VNTALNHAKKRSRVTAREMEEVFEDPATVTQPDAGKRLEAGETERQLKVLLDQLNPEPEGLYRAPGDRRGWIIRRLQAVLASTSIQCVRGLREPVRL